MKNRWKNASREALEALAAASADRWGTNIPDGTLGTAWRALLKECPPLPTRDEIDEQIVDCVRNAVTSGNLNSAGFILRLNSLANIETEG